MREVLSMAKTVLMFQMVTAAGAGAYDAALISENGQVKNQAAWTAPRQMAITKIIPMGANGNFSTLARNAHAADDITFVHPSDTLADYDKVIDILNMFGGKAGIVVDQGESITINTTVTGNATINILIELDDSVTKVNARGIQAAGVNALVANTPTESGGNVPANLNPNVTYRMRGVSLKSTSIQTAYGMLKGSATALPGSNAILTGQGYSKLDSDQAIVMQGTGAEYLATFGLWVTGTAADAANVQFYYIIFECSA